MPLHLAIFVDDDGKMLLAAQKGVQLVLEACAVGHEPGLLGNLDDIQIFRLDIRLRKRAQQILGVDDADDVVDRAAPQRHARERALENAAHDRFRRIVGVDRAHGGAMHHDIG